MLTIHSSLFVILLLASAAVSICLARLHRVGAFNVRVFGQKKVANQDVLDILVQVY